MAVPSENESKDLRRLLSFPSNYLWNLLRGFLPSSSDSNFLGKISNLCRHAIRPTSPRVLRFQSRTSLPLPFPSHSYRFLVTKSEDTSRVLNVLEDTLECVFLNLHIIQKNLQFWKSKDEGSNAQKAYFIIFERGPRAFFNSTKQVIRDYIAKGSGIQSFYLSASCHIGERVTILSSLRFELATFLAKLYAEADKIEEGLMKDPQKALPLLLLNLCGLFSKLEESINAFHASCQSDSSIDGSHLCPLILEKISEVNQEVSQWTDCEIRDAISLIYQNLHNLDSYLFHVVEQHRKPRKLTLYWMRYTCGAVGISICSIWLLRHSRFMGSSDIDNWIREAKDSAIGFWNDRVEKPLLSIRDEVFETFKKRQKDVMEHEEVQLTANSLHRMLLAFSEQTKGQKFPENASDQAMLEIVMARYEKELMHPIQGLVGGELARAILIQVQKLKLDIETAMLELDQILKANKINFAILAALPAFFISFDLLMLLRAWYRQDSRAEGRGRIARIQRRLLIVEVEKRIMYSQAYMDQGLEKDSQYMYGLVLYSLDRLYRAAEKHANATGEWLSLRRDILDLAKPGLQTAHKLIITSRLGHLYDCLLPLQKRQ